MTHFLAYQLGIIVTYTWIRFGEERYFPWRTLWAVMCFGWFISFFVAILEIVLKIDKYFTSHRDKSFVHVEVKR